ncbi:hypothetical protein GCM10010869_09230 [Mesorhizobium tianshanense]|uniref:MFS transporter n=1 Tax=Mesorhizobium tianshanense TaxID=39844 RepID=A0A562NLK1_9HYPH|nr:MFS transporter [Mesorhizobium tianshanense]GLS35335.1 hypothetical protein GCM10010869_09230 [Mesorhizobium tianshanense]
MPQDSTVQSTHNIHWRRNLAVCFAGSFSTLVAMTLLLPFLPLYVEQLGAEGHAAIVQWSGIAYGATFFAAALVAPLWGRLGDRYGRKLMLVRASFGMAICMSLTGLVETVWQLVLLRLLIGFAGGYSSGSTILVAMQTPKDRSGWALGVLSAGITAGALVGPLLGGALPPLIGIRATFLLAGGVIFLAFMATTFLIKENPRPTVDKAASTEKPKGGWSQIPDKRPVVAMLATGMLLSFATMSIEPIITVYVQQLIEDQSLLTLTSGVVMSAAALGAILSASRLGKLADRVGHWNVIIGALATRRPALPDGAGAWRSLALHHQRHPPQCSGRRRRQCAGTVDLGAICRTGRRAAARRLRRRSFRHARGVSRHLRADGRRSGV